MRRHPVPAVLAMVLAMAGPVPASAVEWSAQDLREACADGELYYLYGACAGFLMAALEDAEGLCVPDDATLQSINLDVAAVMGSLEPEPGEEGTPFARRALAATYPC